MSARRHRPAAALGCVLALGLAAGARARATPPEGGRVLTPPPPQLQAPPPAAAPPALAPPAPGQLRTAATGCAAAPDEAAARRHPPPRATRGAAAPGLTVQAVPGGAVITHALAHACCLRAAWDWRLEGRTAVLVERLVGTPCRCQCGSTLRAALGLSPGPWTVAVELEQGGKARRVLAERVNIPPR